MSLTLAVDIGGTDSTKPVAHQRSRSYADKPGVYERLVQAIEYVWQNFPLAPARMKVE